MPVAFFRELGTCGCAGLLHAPCQTVQHVRLAGQLTDIQATVTVTQLMQSGQPKMRQRCDHNCRVPRAGRMGGRAHSVVGGCPGCPGTFSVGYALVAT